MRGKAGGRDGGCGPGGGGIRRRLWRVEAALDTARRCPECEGLGEERLVVWMQGEPEPTPRGCARCGKVGEVCTVIITTTEGDGDAAEPGAQAVEG